MTFGPAAISDAVGTNVNVKTAGGAKGDTQVFGNSTMASNSGTIYESLANFTSLDTGKKVSETGCTSGGATTVGTITGIVDSTHITVNFTCAQALPTYNSYSPSVVGASTSSIGTIGTGYTPGTIIKDGTGTSTNPAEWVVGTTQVGTVSLVSAGGTSTNHTLTSCVVTGTTGGPVPFQATFPMVAGVLQSGQGTLNAASNGFYTTNPSNLSNEPVTTNCGVSGATVSLSIGVATFEDYNTGVYESAPPQGIAAVTVSGSGTGAVVNAISNQLGGILSYGTDDTAALTSIIGSYTNQSSAGSLVAAGAYQRTRLYFPPGNYWVSAPLPEFYGPASIQGAADGQSLIHVDPNLSGSVFSSDELWLASTITYNTEIMSSQKAMLWFHNMKLNADRASPNVQYGFQLNDRSDFVNFGDDDWSGFTGTPIRIGYEQNEPSSHIRESWFTNQRIWRSGTANTYPCMDLGQNGTGGSSDVFFKNIRIFGCYGVGFRVHNDGTAPMSQYGFDTLDIESRQYPGSDVAGCNMTFENNDATGSGNISNMHVVNSQFISMYPGYSAVCLTAVSGANAPYEITVGGTNQAFGGAPYGGAVNMQAGRNNTFAFDYINAWGPWLTLGPTTNGAGNPGVGTDNVFTGPIGYSVTHSFDNSITTANIAVTNDPTYGQITAPGGGGTAEYIAGTGAGLTLTTGPASGTSGDIVTMNGTTGAVQDSGTALSSLPGASVLTNCGSGAATLTATVTPFTVGDWAPTYSVQQCQYSSTALSSGHLVYLAESLVLTTNAYTTAAGVLVFGLPKVPSSLTASQSLATNAASGFTWPGTSSTQLEMQLNGGGGMYMEGVKSGTNATATVATFPPSTTVTLNISGTYLAQ